VGIRDLSLINEKTRICNEPSVQNLNYDNFDTITRAKWYKGLDIDHIIPKELSHLMENIKGILKSSRNLRVVHHNCYNRKTNHDKKVYGIFRKSIKSEISHMVNLLDPNKKLKFYGKCPPSEITLDKMSNNASYEILKRSLLNLIEDLAMDKVYSLQYIKNKAGDTKYKENKEISVLRKKLIDIIISSKDKTNINKPIKKEPPSHRLAALKRASDKKSRKIR
jgi:hypothetical protein